MQKQTETKQQIRSNETNQMNLIQWQQINESIQSNEINQMNQIGECSSTEWQESDQMNQHIIKRMYRSEFHRIRINESFNNKKKESNLCPVF